MGKLITADDVEIIFEKQNPDHACEWCIYVKVRKNDKEQNVLMIRTNNKPYTRFTLNTGNMVTKSKDTLSEVMSNVVELSNLEKEIIDKSIEIIKTNRGGKITLHNPGQQIVYFVLNFVGILNNVGREEKIKM